MAAHEAGENGGTEEGLPQLRMWDEASRETVIGSLEEDGDRWKVLVVVEPVAGDLARGRLAFQRGDERYDTAPVLLEETVPRVVRRATELPDAMLRQLFISARR